jgi:hypothetical protein
MLVSSWTCSLYLQPIPAGARRVGCECLPRRGLRYQTPACRFESDRAAACEFRQRLGHDAACPTNKDVCRKNAFLVPGDVVLTGRTQGAFTCVAYQSFHTRKQNWTTGWLPTSSLAPVEPIQSPKMADWIGSWSHPGGTISISLARVGNWHRRGTNISRGGRCSQLSARAAVVPAQNMIAFADDGRTPFEKA